MATRTYYRDSKGRFAGSTGWAKRTTGKAGGFTSATLRARAASSRGANSLAAAKKARRKEMRRKEMRKHLIVGAVSFAPTVILGATRAAMITSSNRQIVKFRRGSHMGEIAGASSLVRRRKSLIRGTYKIRSF